MPHKFLHNLELRTSSAEQRGVCPAEGVPPNPLRDAQSLRDRTDVMTKKLLSPIRVLSPILRAGEHPTLRRSIGCSAPPAPQITDQMIVEGHGLLRSAPRYSLPTSRFRATLFNNTSITLTVSSMSAIAGFVTRAESRKRRAF
jgi:hypothetical protein